MSDLSSQQLVNDYAKFLIGGHRGARGLMPENSIEGMTKAVQDGSNMLELDVQFTANGEVIVAHDPYINRDFSLDHQGKIIPKKDTRRFIFYKMNYNEVCRFDVGSKVNAKFPFQKSIKTHIPRLRDLINSVENYTKTKGIKPVIYCIEIKSKPSTDQTLHPTPEEIIERVMSVLKAGKIEGRYYIQSFDVRPLIEVKKRFPDIPIAYLTSNKVKTIQKHLNAIGLQPEIYSPQYKLVTTQLVNEAHNLNLKLIPWTVNNEKDMKSLIKKGVDGIITDFPRILFDLRNTINLK